MRFHADLARIADPEHLDAIVEAMVEVSDVLSPAELARVAAHGRASLKPPADLDDEDRAMRAGRALRRSARPPASSTTCCVWTRRPPRSSRPPSTRSPAHGPTSTGPATPPPTRRCTALAPGGPAPAGDAARGRAAGDHRPRCRRPGGRDPHPAHPAGGDHVVGGAAGPAARRRGLRQRRGALPGDGAPAGLRGLDHPDGPRWPVRGARPGPRRAVLHPGPAARHRPPGRLLHLPGLHHPAAVVRRAPRDGTGSTAAAPTWPTGPCCAGGTTPWSTSAA